MTEANRSSEVVVVMGVSGAGKTTIARGIAEATSWEFAEGDDFHPAANVAKMSAGHPLTDEDRWPWLRAIGAWMDRVHQRGHSAIVTCSALRRSYRDLLCRGRPWVRFCELDADEAIIRERLAARTNHYMPPSLLPSQLATMEPLAADEPGVHVPMADTPDEAVRRAIHALGLAAIADDATQ